MKGQATKQLRPFGMRAKLGYMFGESLSIINGQKVAITAGIFSVCAIVCYLLCYNLVSERVPYESSGKQEKQPGFGLLAVVLIFWYPTAQEAGGREQRNSESKAGSIIPKRKISCHFETVNMIWMRHVDRFYAPTQRHLWQQVPLWLFQPLSECSYLGNPFRIIRMISFNFKKDMSTVVAQRRFRHE